MRSLFQRLSFVVGACWLASARAAPPAFDVAEKSIDELSKAMTDGVVTSRQITEQYLARIQAYDDAGPALHAMIALNPRALDDADALDRERAARKVRGVLHGIPIVVKDNYDTADMPTTAGSLALKGSIPPRDAFQVRKLREAGAVILGKTNLHEFARGITTISSLGGQTRNPYDPTRNPGGSSGGTGAAVAANYAAAGMGTDTCGSIRYPAAHNSLVGLRPTLGLSSRSGIVPLSLSQDVGGPLARTVRDVARILDVTAGPDPDDAITRTAAPSRPAAYAASLNGATLRGVKLGSLVQLFGDAPEDQAVRSIVDAALQEMRAAGATIVPVMLDDPPKDSDGVAIIRHDFKFDLDAYLARTPGAPIRSLAEALEKRVVLAALESTFRASADIATRDSDEYRAIVARNRSLRVALIAAMDRAAVSALVYPTLKRTAAPIGEPQRGGNCAASAATGLPAITVPAGFAADSMPVGVEFLGRAFSESDLLRLAFSYEQATHHRRPPSLASAPK